MVAGAVARLTVATWNIWWRHEPWRERQGAILGALRDLDADVVALQEVCTRDPDQPAWLAAGLERHVVTSPDGVDDRYGVANAVLSRWPFVSTEWTYLDVGDLPPHRTLLRAVIDTPFGEVSVYNTHLSHGFDQSELRRVQLRQIAGIIAQGRRPDDVMPPVLMGDLNAVPDSDEMRMLTGRSAPPVDGLVFTDAWEQVGVGPGWTYGRQNPYVTDSAWPDRRLDYVLIGWPRPRPAGNPVSARVFAAEPVEGTVGSDHYGVAVELAVAGTGGRRDEQ